MASLLIDYSIKGDDMGLDKGYLVNIDERGLLAGISFPFSDRPCNTIPCPNIFHCYDIRKSVFIEEMLICTRWQCDSGAGVDAFFHAIYTTKDSPTGKSLNHSRPFLALLGPHCSHVTESVAGVTSYWNIVQVVNVPHQVNRY